MILDIFLASLDQVLTQRRNSLASILGTYPVEDAILEPLGADELAECLSLLHVLRETGQCLVLLVLRP
jgi:hypothetical protein